jgi:hypothetical protein
MVRSGECRGHGWSDILRPRGWVISTAYRRGFSAVLAPHVAKGFVTSGLSLDLLLIFHGMTCPIGSISPVGQYQFVRTYCTK